MTTPVPVPPSRLRKPLWIAVSVVLVAVLVTGVLVVLDRLDRCDGLDDVRRTGGGECVGVSAGETHYGQEPLARAIDGIKAANDVLQEGEYVSVAVFVPMTPGAGSIITSEWVVDQLEGARLAQAAHNASKVRPKVRLLLANPGGDMAGWEGVVEQLDARRRTADHLVAVTGIGLSLENARKAVERLTGLGIPVIGSTITADDLVGFTGLFLPAPTNTRQARAAATYAKKIPARSALVVVDVNKADHYPPTLADAFKKQFADAEHTVFPDDQQYDSSLGRVPNAFAQMVYNICAIDTDLIYFAGRGRDLVELVAVLKARPCADKPVRIFTGDDVTTEQVTSMRLGSAATANVEIFYTEVASSQAWAVDRDRPSEENREFRRSAVEGFLGGPLSFKDPMPTFEAGRIMGYDAVLTVLSAIRRASGEDGNVVDSDQVMQMMRQLNNENAVHGASGTLSYGNDGVAKDKVVPLIRVDRNGATFVALVSG
jgi:ABC-type branched-subunit amino acid transport system substrate-binding protein